MDNKQLDTTININELFQLLWKNIILIVTIIFVFTISANLISKHLINEKYESQTLINISKANSEQTNTNSDYFRYGSELAKRYTIMAKSDSVISLVEKELINEKNLIISKIEISNSFEVKSQNETEFLQIIVTYNNPLVAKQIAESVTKISTMKYIEVFNDAKINIIDQAKEGKLVGPNIQLNTIIGFILGVVIAIGIVLLKEYLDRTIRDEKDVEKYLGLPVLGCIPKLDRRNLYR